MHQEYKIKNYYLEQQNSFLKQELLLKQNTTNNFWKSVQVSVKILKIILKKNKRKPPIMQKEKDTGGKLTSLLKSAALLNNSVNLTAGLQTLTLIVLRNSEFL